MALNVSNVKVDQFKAVFENIYQRMTAKLPSTIQTVHGIVANAYHTKLAGDIVMQDRGAFQSDIESQNVDYTDIILLFKNKVAKIYSDIFQQAEVNASERQNLAKSLVWALNRQEDQLIIDEFVIGAGSTISSVGTNLTVEKIRNAAKSLDSDNVPDNDRFAVVHPNNLHALLEQTEATSSDFMNVKTLVSGDIDTFYGFKFIKIGNMPRLNGLPINAGIRDTFFYQMDSTLGGYGQLEEGGNPAVRVSFDEDNQSYRVIGKLRMGVQTQQGDGIVKVLCDEN